MRDHEILFQGSAFYLEKRKSFISKKKLLGHCQYQNKKALFTDPIFSECFDTYHLPRDMKTNNIGGVSKKVIGLFSSSIIAIDAT